MVNKKRHVLPNVISQKNIDRKYTFFLFFFQIFEKKQTKNMHNETSLICIICGDKARGMNFDALTCMSCKAFFRRHALRSRVHPY